jgi:hydrogenase-4 component E
MSHVLVLSTIADSAKHARLLSAGLPGPLGQIVALLGAALLLSGFAIACARHVREYVTAYLLQSLIITAIAVAIGIDSMRWDLFVVAALTCLVKVILIPRLLWAVGSRLPEQRERTPLTNIFVSLLVALGLTAIAFFTALTLVTPGAVLNEPPLAISVTLILVGLFVLSSRRHVLAQVVGLLTMENGLFSCAIAIVYGMPLLIEFGILFDVLVAVIVLTLLVTMLHRTVTSTDTLDLRRLRG